MRFGMTAAVMALIALAVPAPLYARIEADVLKVVPDSALGVLVVNRLKETSDRIEKLGRDLQVAVPSPLAFAKGLSGVTHGVEETGSLAIALFSGGEGKPPIAALFIPVHDYSTFLRPLAPKDGGPEISRITFFRRPALATHKAGFAVLMEPGQEELLTTIRAWDTGIDKLLDPLNEWATSQSVAVLSLERGTTQVVDQIHGLIESTEKRLPMGSEFYEPQRAALEAARKGFLQLHGELSRCGLGLQFSGHGAAASIRATFKPDGRIAKAVAQRKWPSAGAALNALPAGEWGLAAAGSVPLDTATASANVQRAMIARAKQFQMKPDGEQTKQFEQLAGNLMRHMANLAVAGVLRPATKDASWFEQALIVLVVDNAPQFLADYEKYQRAIAGLYREDKAAAGRFIVKRKQIGGMPGLEIAGDLSSGLIEPHDPKPPALNLFDRLTGSAQRLTSHTAAIDEHRVAISYGGQDGILEIAKAVRSGTGLGTDANAKKAIAMLPVDCNWMVLAEFDSLVQLVNTVMPALDPAEPGLPEFPKSQPAAIGVKLTPLEFEARLALPADLIGKLGEYFAKMREAQQDD
jgi:hypothetical protein